MDRQITKRCSHCGATFPKSVGDSLPKFRARKFCSVRCANMARNTPFHERVREVDGCLEWQGQRNRKGYGALSVAGKMWLAHRFAWTKANGTIPDGMCVLHICDNPPCCNPDHLFVGTQAENLEDMRGKGRQNPPRGSSHPRSKLSRSDVLKLRSAREKGARWEELAKEFGVSKAAARFAGLGITWKHVK